MNSSEVLLRIIEHEGLNKNSFASEISVDYKQVCDIINGDTKSITRKFAEKILTAFPHYNKVWLLTGEGKMTLENRIDNSTMNEGIVKRIVDIMNNENISIDTFANRLNTPRTVVSSMIHNQTTPSYEQIIRITKSFPKYNLNWLLAGEGEMLREGLSEIPHVEGIIKGIPHIEIAETFCGQPQGFDIAVMRKECPVYNTPGMEGADFTIRAKGRSMINRQYPDRSIKEGDYVGCKKCSAGVIRYGEIYTLATSEGIVTKIVRKSERDGYVLLESFNKEEGFEPFEYPIIDIQDMALVVAVASISRWA